MPVDLEWPRRAIVGAIVVIGAVGLDDLRRRAPGTLLLRRKDRQGRSCNAMCRAK